MPDVGRARRRRPPARLRLGAGAIAVCARAAGERELPATIVDGDAALIAELGEGRVLGLVPLAREHADRDAAGRRRGDSGRRVRGLRGVGAAPRAVAAARGRSRGDAAGGASCAPDAALAGQEETYRLLIGVLLRDPEELELLRSRTITPLLAYDGEHDTELLVTLGTFLAHHGSTTETAEAMGLHRHTVGYRLSRVHEVSGLSPYESDGRERLSLGLKAAQILAAVERL